MKGIKNKESYVVSFKFSIRSKWLIFCEYSESDQSACTINFS